jgi:DinB family protein
MEASTRDTFFDFSRSTGWSNPRMGRTATSGFYPRPFGAKLVAGYASEPGMAPPDLLRPLEGQREETLRIIRGLDESALGRVDDDSGWTVRQIVAHLVSTELAMAFTIRRALEGEVMHISPDDRDAFNEAQVEHNDGWDAARCVSELEDARIELRELFAGMTEADLDRQVRWPEWPARTIRTSIPYMLEHEDSHLDQVRRAHDLS